MTSTPHPAPRSVTAGQQQPSLPYRQLRRSRSEKMLGGVCGGLGEYSGLDPVLWRVAMVALTVAGGAGVVVYLLLWVLMPPAPADPARPDTRLDQAVDSLHEKLTGPRSAPPAV
jgi:phage shock protein PspC (stress-responsive transcriptional regulator)